MGLSARQFAKQPGGGRDTIRKAKHAELPCIPFRSRSRRRCSARFIRSSTRYSRRMRPLRRSSGIPRHSFIVVW